MSGNSKLLNELIQAAAAPLRAAVLTPQGRGAVAVIAVEGQLSVMDRFFRAANGKSCDAQETGRIAFGWWGEDPAEEIVFIKTEPTLAEIHCHGGVAAVERMKHDLSQVGCCILSSTAWLDQAEDGLVAECQLALIRSLTRKTAHHLLRQCTLLPVELRALESCSAEERRQRVDALLKWSDFGMHLTTPWKVVICGRPNVGKSSLINALLGYTRSVVYDQPGTTRDVIAAETAFDGWPVELSDTAGLRETDEVLESTGIQLARERLDVADLIVIVLDASVGISEEDRKLLNEFPEAIVVWNKIDLVPPDAISQEFPNTQPVSASSGEGITELISRITSQLVPVEPPPDQPVPVTAWQVFSLIGCRQ